MRVYTDGGFINGFVVPAHAVLDLDWLPASPADALVTLHGNGLTQHILSRDVADISFSSNGATFFSHRVGTAAIATLVDRWLAGWSGHLMFKNGDHVRWTAVAGPPPSAQLLAALQARLDMSGAAAGPVKFMNDQLMVGAQHDMTLFHSSAQAEEGDSLLEYLTGIEDAADARSFPFSRHVFVTGDEHGIAMALSLAILRFMKSTLGCHANLMAMDPDTLVLDAEPDTVLAAADATPNGGLLWVNAYKKAVESSSAWGHVVERLVFEPEAAGDGLAVVVTVAPSAAAWLAGRGLPVIYPY